MFQPGIVCGGTPKLLGFVSRQKRKRCSCGPVATILFHQSIFFADWFPLDSVGNILFSIEPDLNAPALEVFSNQNKEHMNIQYMICSCHHLQLTPELIFYKAFEGILYFLHVSLHFGTWYKTSGAVHVTKTLLPK